LFSVVDEVVMVNAIVRRLIEHDVTSLFVMFFSAYAVVIGRIFDMMPNSNKGGQKEHYFTPKPKSKPKFGIIQTRLRGIPFKFLTASGVFSKKRVDLGTKLLIEAMVLPESGHVLDMGCGYGAVGIAAAKLNPNLHGVMVDINERA